MTLIYITGPSGSGKSTVAHELQRRGIRAYDEDTPGVGAAYNLQTNKPEPVPPVGERNIDWFNNHVWKILDTALENMRSEAATQLVVLCGNSIHDDHLLDAFDRIIYLRLNDADIRSRIMARTDNDYGKNERELKHILERAHELAQRMDHHKTIPISASQPLSIVIDDILLSLP